ncbi:MAG TPA: MBL fold metallo-hydrolase [Gammaproteobacteria bacterium]|nr:MBL fold metallo-hydrolase [Gammaproteobacteria bacterium]
MRQIQPDLWETEQEHVLPGLMTHAYLLVRDDGNVLFYATGHRHEIERMAELGGVSRQYLSHRDEVGASLAIIRQRFGAQLGGHVRERDDFARVCAPDILFDQRERHLGNIEVIPTPGHSPGSTCFLVHSPFGKRYLFTGDTLFLGDDGSWKPGLLPGLSDRDALAASLALLRELRPHVVIASAAPAGTGYQEMAPDDWPAHVDRALSRLGEAGKRRTAM